LLAGGAAREEGAKLLLIGKLVADEVENIFGKLGNHFHERMRFDVCSILLLIADSDILRVWQGKGEKTLVTSMRRDRVGLAC